MPACRPFTDHPIATANPGLIAAAQYYLWSGIGSSTRSTYTTPQRNFLRFCEQHNIHKPLPAGEDLLCLWISHLSFTIHFRSIKVYLYGIRSLHVDLGYASPLDGCIRLERVFRGIKREQGVRSSVRPRFAVTTSVVLLCKPFLDLSLHNHRMIFAAMCTGTGGLFRIGEFTVVSAQHPDPLRLLTLDSITHVHSPTSSAADSFTIHLRASKTDPFRHEVEVSVCWPEAVHALASMLRQLPSHLRHPHSPLFALDSGLPLTRAYLLSVTSHLLHCARVDTSMYDGLSFRRGGATSLSSAGVSDRIIQIMGRWLSNAYKRYIDTPLSVLAAAAQRM